VILLTFVAATPSPTPTASPGAGIFSSPILLSLLIWVPVLMAIAIATMPNPRGRYDTLMKQIAFFTNLGLVFILFVAYNQFENFLPTMQYEERLDWLPAIGVKYHLGIDGPGLVMLVLSGLIGVASVLASLHWRRTMPMASATAMRPVPRAKAPRKERVNEAPAAAGRRRAASGPPGAEGSVTGTRTRRTAGRSGPAGDGRGGGGGA